MHPSVSAVALDSGFWSWKLRVNLISCINCITGVKHGWTDKDDSQPALTFAASSANSFIAATYDGDPSITATSTVVLFENRMAAVLRESQ